MSKYKLAIVKMSKKISTMSNSPDTFWHPQVLGDSRVVLPTQGQIGLA
jgi:hypothetical protein